jgi:hypothetical protein
MPPEDSPAASPLPLQNSVVIDSETESESEQPESELESQPDREYYIENQLGLPEYQLDRRGIFSSSPPPVNLNAEISNELNGNGKFFSRSGLQKLTLRFAKTASRVEVGANKGNDSGAMNTEFLLSLGDKVGT